MSDKKFSLLDSNGILTEEAMKILEKSGDSVSCECPGNLIHLLRSVKEFTQYQEKCITTKPEDEMIHNWLKATSVNLEHLLSSTAVNLARMEGLIDEKNEFIKD